MVVGFGGDRGRAGMNRPGPGVDARGDPTANVLALVEASDRRQDDLRIEQERHQREILALTLKSIDDVARVRADLGEKLRIAESSRIDAIRAVDVAAVSRAADVTASVASTLAVQVREAAEALQARVESAATAQTIAWTRALEPLQKSIDELHKNQYEQQGQRAAQVETKGSDQWKLGFALSLFVALLSLVGFLYVLASR